MRYMLLCYFREEEWEKLPEPRRDEIMKEYGELVQNLAAGGRLRGGAKLGPSTSATTVREKSGRSSITDGPFAETREQLGGYHIVECRDLDEAISIAKSIPSLRAGGTVEVRPVEFEEPLS
jgi:hypothetical protein